MPRLEPSSSTTLIIPVESQVRELDAKLLLACAAAERGFSVLIGSLYFLHYGAASLPRGIYLAKSMRALSDRIYGILGRLGHEIVAWDEESLVRFGFDDYRRRRLSPRILAQVSQIFAWGDDDAEVLRRVAGPDTPVYVTGNPRVDLTRPELRGFFDREAESIRRRFDPFVLVNTNFSFVNAFVASQNLLQPGPGGRLTPGDNAAGMTTDFARGVAGHKQALFEHFRAMIPRLAEALPDHTIVVRPHPAEHHAPWLEAAKEAPNVEVANEGNVLPWLIAAKAMVHNGCTTAVEAALLDTPAVSFRPVVDETFDLALPDSLSHPAFDLDDLLETVGSIVGRPKEPAGVVQRKILEHHIASLEGPLAADRIADELAAAHHEVALARPRSPSAFAFAWLHAQTRRAVKATQGRRADHKHASAAHAHRFPGTSVRDLSERMERLSAQLGRFSELRVSEWSQHVFRIER